MAYQLPEVLIRCRAVVLNAKRKILLIKRSGDDSFMPGKWEIPGGKMDAGDDFFETLAKEVIEEVSLIVKPLSIMSYVESAFLKEREGGKSELAGKPYITITSLVRTDNSKVVLSDEHTDFVWATFTAAMELDLKPSTKKGLLALEQVIRDSPLG